MCVGVGGCVGVCGGCGWTEVVCPGGGEQQLERRLVTTRDNSTRLSVHQSRGLCRHGEGGKTSEAYTLICVHTQNCTVLSIKCEWR